MLPHETHDAFHDALAEGAYDIAQRMIDNTEQCNCRVCQEDAAWMRRRLAVVKLACTRPPTRPLEGVAEIRS